MAFSQALEEVIEAALADGVLTDKERAVLHKRAMAEGVDPDELDVVIEGRLAKMKREMDWLKPAPPASEKLGNIVKCPSCGAPIQGGVAVCPDCGHEFRNVKVNSSAKIFAEGLARIRAKESNKKVSLSDDFKTALNGGKLSETAEFITNFPIPNTSEDLLEMLSSIQGKSSNVGFASNANNTNSQQQEMAAYWELYTKCINKARMSFSNDSRFVPYYSYFEKESKKTSPRKKAGIVILLLSLLIFGGIGIACLMAYIGGKDDDKEIEKQRVELTQKISSLNTPTEENYESVRNDLLRINWVSKYSDRDEEKAKSSFMDEKRAFATILNAFYKERHNGEDDPALADILTVPQNGQVEKTNSIE